jgi:hypothetical protein
MTRRLDSARVPKVEHGGLGVLGLVRVLHELAGECSPTGRVAEISGSVLATCRLSEAPLVAEDARSSRTERVRVI